MILKVNSFSFGLTKVVFLSTFFLFPEGVFESQFIVLSRSLFCCCEAEFSAEQLPVVLVAVVLVSVSMLVVVVVVVVVVVDEVVVVEEDPLPSLVLIILHLTLNLLHQPLLDLISLFNVAAHSTALSQISLMVKLSLASCFDLI